MENKVPITANGALHKAFALNCRIWGLTRHRFCSLRSRRKSSTSRIVARICTLLLGVTSRDNPHPSPARISASSFHLPHSSGQKSPLDPGPISGPRLRILHPGLTLLLQHVINARFALVRPEQSSFSGRSGRRLRRGQAPTLRLKVLRWKRVRNSGGRGPTGCTGRAHAWDV
jgi:hypothetical protein